MKFFGFFCHFFIFKSQITIILDLAFYVFFFNNDKSILGLTLEESTDLNLLYKNLDKLDRQLKDLNISFRTRYVPKSHKVELKERLDNKVNERDDLLRQGQIYRYKRSKLKIAVESAQAYNRVKPPHQTVGDAVIFALAQARGLQKQEKGRILY